MAERDFEPGGRVRLHAKDARIVMAAADGAGLRLPGFEPVAAAFEELVRTGRGDLDHSSLVLLVDQDAPPSGGQGPGARSQPSPAINGGPSRRRC
jgi:2-hydroxy-3-oxopropionate reductase